MSTTRAPTTGAPTPNQPDRHGLLLDLANSRMAILGTERNTEAHRGIVRRDGGDVERVELATGTVAALRALARDVNVLPRDRLPEWARPGGNR